VKSYIEGDPGLVSAVKLGGYRTVVAVPMLKDNVLIGAIAIFRQEVRPFTDKQITLVQNFAAQAVIAIENTRLLNELRQRTADLSESLEQQTATSEVLRVISSSQGELQPVFQAMLENATRICEAYFATLLLREGSSFRAVALYNAPPAYVQERKRDPLIHPTATSALTRLIATKQTIHITDLRTDQSFLDRSPGTVVLVEAAGARSYIAVPMLKDDDLIGTIIIYRQEVRPFTDKQIALMQNFAAQAVIAIENARLLNELRQSLDQQTATADVLKAISTSSGELSPVFHAVLENATQLCGAKFGHLYLCEGDEFRSVAMHNAPAAFVEARGRNPLVKPESGSALEHICTTKQVANIPDVTLEKGFVERQPRYVAMVELGGFRALLAVPMLKDGALIGSIMIYRQEIGNFSEKQIEVVQNFAAQAVIAIENARLLNDLRESLQQQTATSEVLGVISSSPGELEPVFQAMLENATRICEATIGRLYLYEGTNFRGVALHHSKQSYVDYWQRYPVIEVKKNSGIPVERLVNTKQVVHIPDLRTDQSYVAKNELIVALADVGGVRTFVAVPMLKDGELIGSINMYRQEVHPFTDKQIELVKNFAAQAVIAIENTRLLNELHQRTDDLGEALQQQTATAEVLKVIARTQGELQPVFETMLAKATELCGASYGALWLRVDDGFRYAALHGDLPQIWTDHLRNGTVIRVRPDVPLARLMQTLRPVPIPDMRTDAGYLNGDPLPVSGVDIGGIRTLVLVPMIKNNDLIGAIAIYRKEVRPFAEKQIELLSNFAAQAVIAIENTRLLNELRQSLQQQTATADVLKTISRSTFDLQTVLQTLIESAAKLCDADKGNITRQKGGVFYRAETYGLSKEISDYIRSVPVVPERGTAQGRALLEGKVVHIPDVQNDPEYTWADAQRLIVFRTALGVPMLREGVPIGVFALTRSEVRPFTEKQIELVTTFADQAAIAIENVRLFDEIQNKSRQLEEASQHKSQFLANMSHELRTPLNAILGYTELMTDGAYGEPSEKMLGILKRLEANGKHLLGLINDVLDLSKIEAGQLVLELSDYCIQDIAQTVRSTLEPLAADKKLAFKVELSPDLPPGLGDGRRLTQVLINLVGNAIKFTDAGEVAIKAEANNGSFHVSVRDTGPGISAADQAKLFQEFQQADNAVTRKKGGTGLGLAISKRIIEMHGGKIWVESQPGHGSTFTFSLPVIVERQMEAA
jgi:GAF domain-containing protein